MDPTKAEGVLRRLSQLDFTRMAKSIVEDGEEAYKGNRDATRAFIIEHNDIKGLRAVERMLAGMDSWEASIEDFEDAAKKIARKANEALRGRQVDRSDEADIEEVGDMPEGSGRHPGSGEDVTDN